MQKLEVPVPACKTFCLALNYVQVCKVSMQKVQLHNCHLGAKIIRGFFSNNLTLPFCSLREKMNQFYGLSKVRCHMLYLGLRLVESGSGYRICWIRIKSGSRSRPRCLKKNFQIYTLENKFGEKMPFLCFLTTTKNYVQAPGKVSSPSRQLNFLFFCPWNLFCPPGTGCGSDSQSGSGSTDLN